MVQHLASSMFKSFKEHEWRGHLPGLGYEKQLPLLSRLAGGVNVRGRRRLSAED